MFCCQHGLLKPTYKLKCQCRSVRVQQRGAEVDDTLPSPSVTFHRHTQLLSLSCILLFWGGNPLKMTLMCLVDRLRSACTVGSFLHCISRNRTFPPKTILGHPSLLTSSLTFPLYSTEIISLMLSSLRSCVIIRPTTILPDSL